MTPNQIKRVRYFERQFLGTRDFQDEQTYHIAMRRKHLIGHHRFGIVTGLGISQDSASKVWSVQPGMAVDGWGREIIVLAPVPLDTARIMDQLRDAPSPAKLKVWIAYYIEKVNLPLPGYEDCDQPDQFTRVQESFRLIYADNPPMGDPTKPPDPFEKLQDDPKLAPWPVYLGTITWDIDPANAAQKVIAKPMDVVDPRDGQSRQYIGLVGAEITPPIVAQNDPPSNPPLKTTLTLRAEETNVTGQSAGTSNRLIVDGDVQLNGGKLDLRAGGGGEADAPLLAYRGGVKDFRVQIGDNATDGARLVVGPGSEEKLIVEGSGDTSLDGDLVIKNSNEATLEGGRLAFKSANGTETPDITDISRKDNPATGHQDLRVGIGSSSDLGARFVVGPKQGDNVEEKLVVLNNGDVIVGGRLTVQGFSLFHRGADLIISGRTGGNPRALVDGGDKLIVNYANDYSQGVEVQGALDVQGDISLGGQVDGRNLAADGAKLDGISSNAKNVAVLAGDISDGDTIPLPQGFAESQCQWLVSPRILDPNTFDINEIDVNAKFKVECYTTGRTVTVGWYQQEQFASPPLQRYPGTANYLIIGIQ